MSEPGTSATPPCHCTVTRRAARAITSVYDRALEPVGLSISQYALLRNLQRGGPMSVSRLARVLRLERTTLVRNLRPLEAARRVTVRGGEDQRERIVVLTSSGTRTLERAVPLWSRAQETIERRLGAERLRLLHEVLLELEDVEAGST